MTQTWLRRNFRVLAILLVLLIQAGTAFAMGPAPQGGFSDRQVGDACGTACGSFLFIIVAWVVTAIAILVWVAKDAKNRGMGSAVGWVFLILFTHLLGLIIYLFSRPSGDLIICEHCHNKKLMVARLCPHCGNLQPSPGSTPTHKETAARDRADTPAPTATVSTGQAKFCKNCGSKVLPDSLFCEECGNRIQSS